MGDVVIATEQLVLPHPSIAKRNFVLAPLVDIASSEIYPTSEKSVHELFLSSTDQIPAVAINERLKKPKLPYIDFSYVALEGNIGAGKTSLASMIAADYNAKFIPERFKDNPFLPKFYKDQSRYAFPLEMSFLADRHQQLLDDISQFDLFSEFVVADYDIYKSLIFARVTLGEDEFHLYKKVFDIMYKDLPKPDLYIYLYQNTERLLANIKKRGRSYEQEIPSEYLENINQGYLNFIKRQQHLNIKIIDISELDFVNNREDYLFLLHEIATK
jgi:deoxyadenosine/deoxycytidine kinase